MSTSTSKTEPKTTPAGTGHGRMRWYVRLEHVRPAPFGERPRSGLAWAVFSYIYRAKDGHPLPLTASTYFTRRDAAFAYAHRQARHTYGARP